MNIFTKTTNYISYRVAYRCLPNTNFTYSLGAKKEKKVSRKGEKKFNRKERKVMRKGAQKIWKEYNLAKHFDKLSASLSA